MSGMTISARTHGGGFDLTLEIDRDQLLPGRLVDGRLRITATRGGTFRGARVTLIGTETWRYDQSTTDAEGHVRTEIRTGTAALPHVPIALAGQTSLAAGQELEFPFQLPVPSLGPASFDGTELRIEWDLEAKLDVAGFDPGLVLPVRVLQPTALLRAGVIDVAQFALFDEAGAAAGDLRGTLRLEPVPLCVGAPFRGVVALTEGSARTVQEVRLELRVTARSTVGGGRSETITLWAGRLAGPGEWGGAGRTDAFEGVIPDRPLPTIETAHGRADAAFHLVVAVAWARDPHLVRDVAICSTTEL